jgi:hypothetical protein
MDTRWPIKQIGKIFWLETSNGERLSFHRTISGALRARARRIEEEDGEVENEPPSS